VLLEAAMEIPDVRDRLVHDLAVGLQLEPKHPVGGGVLGTHVERHHFAAEIYFHDSSRIRSQKARSQNSGANDVYF
jgi:hypothetical protein